MGNLLAAVAPYSQFSQQFPPTSAFEPKRDVPDLTGKVIVVTGAYSGIGYETTKELLRKNAKVYLACRDSQKTKETVGVLVNELKKEANSGELGIGPGEGVVLQLDLSDLASVKRAATELLSKEERVDVLINNAGVMLAPFEWLTKQNYDLRTNVLGHYYFTTLLMPALERSTAHNKEKARVVTLSSGAHTFPPGKTGFDWHILKGGAERDKAIKDFGMFSNWKLYGVGKMGNVLMANFMARHYGDKISSCSLNPGGIRTGIQRHIPLTKFRALIRQIGLHPPYLGAYTSLFAATVVPSDEINGKFFQPWARFGRSDPRANNKELQDQLKEWLEKEVEEFERSR